MDYTAMGVEVVYVGMFLMTLLFCGSLHLHTDDTSNEVVNKGEDPKGAASIEVDTGERVESVISVSKPSSSSEGSIPHCNQCSVLSAQLQALWQMLSGANRGRAAMIQSAVFFAVAFVLGAVTSLLEAYEFLFFVQDLHASASMCGVSVVITVMFEIPIFFLRAATPGEMWRRNAGSDRASGVHHPRVGLH